jgi:hypothetical protein
MQLLKKKVNKNDVIGPLIQANYQCKQVLEYIKQNVQLTDDEKKEIEKVQEHLINLSIIFGQIK